MTSANTVNPLEFPLFGTRLIEASAGTGKTYTIAALYVRLILGHWVESVIDRPELLPPDILVVTFTEASTQELRERIRARLSQAASYFRQQFISSDDFLSALRADYPTEQWPICARRLELAANWMDESAVFTIHSWCNRMLQQHAFDSGSLFRQEVNTDDTELLNEVVRDYWRTFFYPLNESQCQAVFKLASSPESLTQKLKPLLSETEALGLECTESNIAKVFSEWEQWRNQLARLETQAKTLWTNQLSSIESLLNNALTAGWLNGTSYNKKNFTEKLQEMANWAANRQPIGIDAIAKFSQQKLESGLVKAHKDKSGALQHAAFTAIAELVEIVQQEPDIAAMLTVHAIHWIRHRYDSEKQRTARISFDDMLTRLDDALHGTNGDRLADVIRKQYPIALIDEFQDTDPVQYRIFAKLYPANTETQLGCFMIGDPKQAIYSFRGGDIYTYLKAYQATVGNHYTLDTNFRSTKDLVESVNQVFSQAEHQPEGAFRFKAGDVNPLPFINVNAKGRDEQWLVNDLPAPALTFWHWQSAEAVGMPEYRKQLAQVTASEIVRLLNLSDQGLAGFKVENKPLQPMQPSDIAILVRSGQEAGIIRQALAERQLRSVYLSERESIYATTEAADLLLFLNAMAEPRNERKVRAALSTATFNWPYQALQQLTIDEPAWEQQLERFLGYQQCWQQDGILPALRRLINDYHLHAKLITDYEGERSITNLLHLAELMQQASGQLEGEQALIRYLAEAIDDTINGQSADESIIRLESDANLIKIITIHKSKGLEYPLVFLPFICSYREVTGRNSYYRYHDEQQQLHVDLNKTEPVKTISDNERLQEDLRLLYVAITRARYACWLGVAPVKSGSAKKCQLHKNALGYLLGWRDSYPASQLEDCLQNLKGACDSIAVTVLPEPTFALYQSAQSLQTLESPRISTQRVSDNWWIASYSALQIDQKSLSTGDEQKTADEPETAQQDKQTDEADQPLQTETVLTGIHSIVRGAAPGVLIHSLLEACAVHGFAHVLADPDLQQSLIDQLFSQNIWDDKRPIIAQALPHWLSQSVLENKAVSLAQLPGYQAEMEFLIGAKHVDILALDNLVSQHLFAGKPRPRLMAAQVHGLLKGFIDLVFEVDGQFYVADYKFNGLGTSDAAYSPAALIEAMLAKRYDLQAALYLLALHRLLKTRLGDDYDYDQHIGGSVYLFLRGYRAAGGGKIVDKPPKLLIESLDQLFSGARAAA